jgi:hypothetical protein
MERRMKRILALRLVVGLVAVGALDGCAFYGWPHWDLPGWEAFPRWSAWRYGRVAYAESEPPPSIPVEVIPDSPGAGYAWVAGRWRWHDEAFQWINGSWEKPPGGMHEWVPGRWDFDLHGWYYVNGRWE